MAFRPTLDRVLQQHLQPVPRLGVACAAGLQIGKPYTAPANKPVSFEDMSLIPTLMEALRAAGFSKPTEIQVRQPIRLLGFHEIHWFLEKGHLFSFTTLSSTYRLVVQQLISTAAGCETVAGWPGGCCAPVSMKP
jgi:hypothetical protein